MHNLTAAQQEAIEAMKEVGSLSGAAKKLGIGRTALLDRLQACARKGVHVDRTTPVPAAHTITKSTLHVRYDADGKASVVAEWPRIAPEVQDVQRVVQALVEEVKGRGRLPPCNVGKFYSSLMAELPIVDLHHGKYAWKDETGCDWDVSKSAEAVQAGIGNLLSRIGKVWKIVVPVLGDFFHSDNRHGTTEKSGHILDVDTRFQNVASTGVMIMHNVISECCRHAHNVEVVIVPGNHDFVAPFWMSMVLSAFYSKCGNVTVCQKPTPRRYVQWGKVLIGMAHGNGPKLKDWVNIMAVEQPQMWSESKHRTWHLGHIHRGKSLSPLQVDTEMGCTVEFLNALTATDAWHTEQGYVNPIRRAEAFVWDKEEGLVQRLYKDIV